MNIFIEQFFLAKIGEAAMNIADLTLQMIQTDQVCKHSNGQCIQTEPNDEASK